MQPRDVVQNKIKEKFYISGTREIKTRIAMAKEVFNIKIPLLTSRINSELRKKLVRCYVWSIALDGLETRVLRNSKWKYMENFEM